MKKEQGQTSEIRHPYDRHMTDNHIIIITAGPYASLHLAPDR